MEDQVMIFPSARLVSLPQKTPPLTLQQRLQFILQSQQDWWAYAIFWETTQNVDNGQLLLTWGDGHFQATNSKLDKLTKFSNTSSSTEDHPVISLLHSEGRKFMSSTIQSMIGEKHQGSDNMHINADLTDAKWFYDMSLTRSFSTGDSEPGKAFAFERAKEAQMHGIETFICIPTSTGVLEMGSPIIIREKRGLVQQAKSLFESDLTGLASRQLPTSNLVSIQFLDQNICFADIGINASIQEDEKHFDQQKQKGVLIEVKKADCINGGQSSYPLSVLHVSDSDHPPIFVNVEKKTPKKRGRKPGLGRDTRFCQVEAERQRREKLKHGFHELGAVVPNVSWTDKASLLSGAVSYIDELKTKMEELQSEFQIEPREAVKLENADTMDNQSINTSVNQNPGSNSSGFGLKVEVEIVGLNAIVRVHSENHNYPTAQLMGALRDLEFQVLHGSISCVEELVLQDVVIRVPDRFGTEESLKVALLEKLKY